MKDLVIVMPLLISGLYYLAQTGGAESLSGGAGWVGAGLLGAVLTWLLFIHLPAKDRLMKELINDKDGQLQAVLEHKWVAIQGISSDRKDEVKGLAVEFRMVIVEMAAHCDKEVERMVRLVETRDKRIDELSQILRSVTHGRSAVQTPTGPVNPPEKKET